jgi:hypothetical protein
MFFVLDVDALFLPGEAATLVLPARLTGNPQYRPVLHPIFKKSTANRN